MRIEIERGFKVFTYILVVIGTDYSVKVVVLV